MRKTKPGRLDVHSGTRTAEGDGYRRCGCCREQTANKHRASLPSDSLPAMNSVVIKSNFNEIRFAEYGLQIPAIKILPCQAVSLS